MATRFYLPSSGTAAASPAYEGSWGHTAGADRLPLATAPTDTAMLENLEPSVSLTGPIDVLHAQYVSDALPAGQVSGAVKGMLHVRESGTGRNCFAQVVVKVVSGDGSTLRGVLLDPTTSWAASAEYATAGTNPLNAGNSRKFPSGWSTPGATLTPVTAQAGDRIVIEVGSQIGSVTVGCSQFAFGDLATLPDTLEAENTAPGSDYRPWFEFSQDLFGAPAVTVDGDSFAVTTTALDGTAVTQTPITVTGEPFAAGSAALDGAVVPFAVRVRGDAFRVTTSALDGVVVGAAMTVSGQSFAIATTARDGSPIVGAGSTVVAATVDSANRANGRTRTGIGYAEVTYPDPADNTDWEPIRIMAQSVPVPTLDEGRPA